jgi:hypothetical protein
MDKLKSIWKLPIFSLLVFSLLLSLTGQLISQEAIAIMAGAAPDSPSNRVDPNTNLTFAGVGTLSGGCTGKAITSSHILTAAHCGDNNSFTVNNLVQRG